MATIGARPGEGCGALLAEPRASLVLMLASGTEHDETLSVYSIT